MSAGSIHGAHASTRVGPIDALRCFAMTAVVAQHNGLLPFGWTGVWLFFVISGFVVTQSVISRPSADSPAQGLSRFFERRVRRIVPIYYAYIGAALLFCLFVGGEADPIVFASLLGFFNNVATTFGHGALDLWPVGHLWTISVEMQFYAVYGVLLFLMSRNRLMVLLACSIVTAPVLRMLASIYISGFGWDSEAMAFAIYAGSFLHVDAFAVGALLAMATQKGLIERIARPLAATGFSVLGCYAIIYVSINYSSGARGIDAFRNVISGIIWGQYREVFLYSAVVMASGGLVALAAVKDPLVDWLLRSRVLQRIGEISYGAYVYHALAIVLCWSFLREVFGVPGDDWPLHWRIARFVLSYTLTIVAAELSYHYFETRFIRGKRGKTTAAQVPPYSTADLR